MVYGSVCSGIEAATLAWKPLGWEATWFSEIEPFPSQVLKHHYPSVPNLGDMSLLDQNEIYRKSSIELLVGGTPCQSFSIAGLRGGLDDQRGNLALEFCRILISKQPRWFVWENVPGVFSSNTGRDFATILEAFRECGYSTAYRVLDSKHFGVPQRRRRVFVIGYLGNDWRPPVAVLFESESLQRDFTEGRKERENITDSIKNGFNKWPASNTLTLDKSFAFKNGLDNQHINNNASLFVPISFKERAGKEGGGKGLLFKEEEVFTLSTITDQKVLVFDETQITSPINKSIPRNNECHTLSKGGRPPTLFYPSIRRLTPLECERLQGFPDNYTNIPGASDSARYSAIGNSMTKHVMGWLGKRIDMVDKILDITL